MANDLRLKVLLDAVDKATAPLRQINQGSQETARGLKATRERLKELNAQQKDISGWRQQNAQARETAQALDAARAQVRQMGRQMSATTAPTKQMNAEFQAAIRATNALKQKQKEEQEALRGLQRRLGAAGISTRNLNQHAASLRQELSQTNTTIEQQEAHLKRLAAVQRKAAEAKSRLEKAQGRAGSMVGAGAAGVAAGSGILLAGAALVAPQMEVQQQGSLIAAQSGDSPDRADQYSAMIRNIRTDGQSTDIAAIGAALAAAKSTLGALGSVGDKELDSAARKALDLSTAMGIDVAESVQMVGILMKNGLAGSSDEAFDLVTSGLQKVSTQMRGEIPEILHEYSTHFRGMGFNGTEAMSLLVKMAEQGKFALDKTGDAIKEFSIRGSDLSKSSREAYASIGLNAEKMSSSIAKGGPDARQALLKTAKGLLAIKNPAERANAAIALFGTPVEDLAIDQIPAFLQALSSGTEGLGNIEGAADSLGTTLRDNLGGDLDKLTGTWSALMGTLMDGQNGPLRELVQSITGVIKQARSWIEANPELAAGIAKGAAAAAVLVAVMGALTIAMASFLGPFAMARYGMTLFGTKSARMVPVLGKLISILGGGMLTALRSVSIALWGLAANPVVLAIAAVVAVLAGAAYLIYRNWDQVKVYFSSTWAAIKTGFSSSLATILNVLAAFNPMGLIYQSWEQVKTYFTGSWAEIKAGFSGGITGILTTLANFSPIGLVYQAFASVLNYLGIDLPTRFTEFGGMIVNGLVNGLMAGLGQIKQAMSTLGSSTIGWFKEKLGIHSPSRVFSELGGFTTEGLAQGLDAGAKAPLSSLTSLSKQLTEAGAFDLNASLPLVRAGAELVPSTEAVTPTGAGEAVKGPLDALAKLELPSLLVSAPVPQVRAAADLAAPAQTMIPTDRGPAVKGPFDALAKLELPSLQVSSSMPQVRTAKDLVAPAQNLTQTDVGSAVKGPLDILASIGKQLGRTAAMAMGVGITSMPAVAVDNRPPITAAPAASYDSNDQYNINIHPPAGMDPMAIARAVGAELDRREREKSARRRSSLSDQE